MNWYDIAYIGESDECSFLSASLATVPWPRTAHLRWLTAIVPRAHEIPQRTVFLSPQSIVNQSGDFPSEREKADGSNKAGISAKVKVLLIN